LDGGSTRNFVSEVTAKAAGVKTLNHPMYLLVMADGRKVNAVCTDGCTVTIRDYHKKMDLLVAPIAHDIILSRPWLDEINPSIDWKNSIVNFQMHDGKNHEWHLVEEPPIITDTPLIAKQFEQMIKPRGI
jgi:hypothetical protein